MVDVVYQDDELLIVLKPAGLLSVPGRGPDKQDCVFKRLVEQISDALVVHRLDMATSGLMVFARHPAAQRQLSGAFAQGLVHKQYRAIVRGVLTLDHGQIDAPLWPDWPNRPRQKIDPIYGKPSLTHYTVLQRDRLNQQTHVLLQPLSGRTHQLRVHMLSIGHPIVGDALYAEQWPAARLMLHASRLQLTHPLHGAMLSFDSASPF
jgi:tRNA pseudouridine32 synthase / 23S rRNA pseudouridine746 synthase